MSALDILREIKAAARMLAVNRPETVRQDDDENEKDIMRNNIEWGSMECITSIGIDNMNRRELRNHLEARDLSTNGTRTELVSRLRESMADEEMRNFASVETALETKNVVQSDIEERGSVYACGSNSKGELGLGDTLPRRYFTVIPQLRGVGANYVAAGIDMCYAITDEHDVYVWGGGGFGRTGLAFKLDQKKSHGLSNTNSRYANSANQNRHIDPWLQPQLLTDLIGEECSSIYVGMSHCIALGRGGDCFVWGENDTGQLGMNDFEGRPNVTINNNFQALALVHCGANHSVGLYPDGQTYAWGHASNGRLGIGAVERLGVMETESLYWPLPQHIKTLEPIKQIACGADHTLAYGPSGVWAWGSGAGGKLGLGDTKDRFDPCLIQRLRGKFILQLVAGTWHSLALVAYPPMIGGGWIHSWGSGYHGQLAQGSTQVSLVPEVIEYFPSIHTLIKFIATGSHHVAAIASEGELYTWGSNVNGCLGRKISETDVLYTPVPGYVSGFGAIVGKTGRGLPRYVACGKEFTVVCTHPYTGPDLLVATKLMEEAKFREQETLLAKRAEQQFKDENVS